MLLCKNCKFFKKQRENVQERFIDPDFQSTGYIIISKRIKMCHHFSCFKYSQKNNVSYGPYKIKERIKGQAQLNRNYDCELFKKIWWKFWVKYPLLKENNS